MNILVTGSGGREHALAWKLAQSDRVGKVFVAPGNAGTSLEPGIENVDIDPLDFPALIDFARSNSIDLTVVGPEAPLVEGMVDTFQAAGLDCFGPVKAAAQLEGSKTFTKNFLARYGIPTAAYASFDDPQAACDYIDSQALPIVIKADGLAAGKGVVIAATVDEAKQTVRDMLGGDLLGAAGARVVVEEFMVGEEASYIAIADGKTFLPFATSQDHKAAYDGDQGPNTGGMGAYSPAPVVTEVVEKNIVDRVINPTLAGMAAEGYPYTGFLYAGLMIDPEGNPRVVEFNCRFGDPETQPIVSRLETDLVDLITAAQSGELDGQTISFDPRPALTVVMASGGYPGSYNKGATLSGLDAVTEAKVFHAGTALDGDHVVTAGGRVLGVTALGETVAEAQKSAYKAVARINFEGAEFRTDIGYRAVAREEK